jgi:hypothetical protein
VVKKKKTAKPIDIVEFHDDKIEEAPAAEKDVKVDADLETQNVFKDGKTEKIEENTAAVIEEISLELKNKSVWRLVVGGIVAVAFGFVVAQSNLVEKLLPPSWRMTTKDIVFQEQISKAQDEIDSLKVTLTKLFNRLETMPQTLSTDTAELISVVEDLAVRIDVIESRPAVVKSENADVIQLREVVEKQQIEIDRLLANLRFAEQTPQEDAKMILARAAASQILAAIESGTPFETALADLEATGVVEIPEVLIAAAAEGVVTLTELQNLIPAAARAGLAASPQDAESGLGDFLKRQFGARSIAPREGDDADAVLSRVEGAIRQGRLMDALAEAETLAPEVISAMSDWLGNTATRLAVTNASETLMRRLKGE